MAIERELLMDADKCVEIIFKYGQATGGCNRILSSNTRPRHWTN